jgi:hypothetical protein
MDYLSQGDSLQLAVERALPASLLDELGRTNGDRKTVARYWVEIGCSDELEAPGIRAENLWVLDRPTETSRADAVQQELAFPASSWRPAFWMATTVSTSCQSNWSATAF